MRRSLLLLVLLPLPSCASAGPSAPTSPSDSAPTGLLPRMEAMTKGIPRLAWDVLTEGESGSTAMDAGYKVQGRFVRDEGIRIKATAMGSAHGMSHGAPPGPNLHQLLYMPDRVAVALSVLTFESGRNTRCLPHLLFRARRGDPDHAAVDPRLLPGNDPILLRYHDPLTAYQLAPAILFGHEPGLEEAGTATVRGAACVILRSRHVADAGTRRGPEGWYPARSVEKRFYIEAASGLIAALEIEITGASSRVRMRHEVASRQTFGGLDLPRFVEIHETGPEGSKQSRQRVDLDPGDT
ncbi:MAG TPA: hypothetical protein VFC90_00575 [Planctomycetota bacterium]|nr:hypothetical protein [Planctomycetota bacterium]